MTQARGLRQIDAPGSSAGDQANTKSAPGTTSISIGSEPMRDRNWPAQIVAVGPRLVILTPPLPDPIEPEKRLTPRCIVIDPRTYAVEYSGPIAPHDEPAPTTAPLPGPGQ